MAFYSYLQSSQTGLLAPSRQTVNENTNRGNTMIGRVKSELKYFHFLCFASAHFLATDTFVTWEHAQRAVTHRQSQKCHIQFSLLYKQHCSWEFYLGTKKTKREQQALTGWKTVKLFPETVLFRTTWDQHGHERCATAEPHRDSFSTKPLITLSEFSGYLSSSCSIFVPLSVDMMQLMTPFVYLVDFIDYTTKQLKGQHKISSPE